MESVRHVLFTDAETDRQTWVDVIRLLFTGRELFTLGRLAALYNVSDPSDFALNKQGPRQLHSDPPLSKWLPMTSQKQIYTQRISTFLVGKTSALLSVTSLK